MRDRLAAARLLVTFPFRVDPWRTPADLVIVGLTQLAGVLIAVALRLATNAVVDDRGHSLIVAAVLLLVAIAVTTGGDWCSFVLRTSIGDRSAIKLDAELAELCAAMAGTEHFERPDYLDRIEHLRQFRQNLVIVPNQLASSVAIVIRIVVSLVLLAEVQPLLALLPLFGIPALLATQREHRLLNRIWDGKVGALNRLQNVLRQMVATEPGGREARVFGIQGELQERYREILDEADGLWEGLSLNCAVVESAGWLVLGAAFVGALVLLAHQALAHQLSAGDVVLVITLVTQLSTQVTSLAGATSMVGGSLRTAERLVWLQRLAATDAVANRSAPGEPPARLSQGIELRAVTFTYPGTEAVVLRGVDLSLPAGGVVAVVGENGAGKTTLVKLLLRMYEPSSGSILVDGTPLRDLDVAAWRRRCSASFQDFARFEFSAREAVGVGLLEHMSDEARIVGAVERASAGDVVEALPHGLASQLGRNFDEGTELSGGQWQKLALARSMMRHDPLLLVLDEPTASLDPAIESQLFARFADAARAAAAKSGGVTFIVSHRLSTVRSADLIVVLADGEIRELGSHDELMAKRGRYAEMFELQATGYR